MNTDFVGPGASKTARHRARPRPAVLPVVAWATTVAVSALPAIVFAEVGGAVPGWLPLVQIGTAVTLLVVGTFWAPLRPLRRFAVVMAVLPILLELASRADWDWPAAQQLLGATAFDARMQAEQTGKLAVALAMIGILMILGLRRRDFFLTRGDLGARIRPVRLLGFPRAEPWWRFGLVWGFGIAGALAVVQFLLLRPTASQFSTIVPMIPSILVYVALNAFSEEMTYRAPILATLEPAVGGGHALWVSAVFFGVAHYFGIPGGIAGALLAVFMGWILSKAMLETRGLLWPWFIHFLSDVAIFVFIAVGLEA